MVDGSATDRVALSRTSVHSNCPSNAIFESILKQSWDDDRNSDSKLSSVDDYESSLSVKALHAIPSNLKPWHFSAHAGKINDNRNCKHTKNLAQTFLDDQGSIISLSKNRQAQLSRNEINSAQAANQNSTLRYKRLASALVFSSGQKRQCHALWVSKIVGNISTTPVSSEIRIKSTSPMAPMKFTINWKW